MAMVTPGMGKWLYKGENAQFIQEIVRPKVNIIENYSLLADNIRFKVFPYGLKARQR